jgi:hypothetical protein
VQIERVPIASLTPDPANARRHGQRNKDTIKAALLKFGQQKPIVVDAAGRVIAGNGTLLAATDLGWTVIDVVRTALAGADAKAYGIADNRAAELAEWDEPLLGTLLAELQSQEYEMTSVGFDAGEMSRLTGMPGLQSPADGTPAATATPDESRARAAPQPVIQYTIVFDTEAQQQFWFKLVRTLKTEDQVSATVAARLHKFLVAARPDLTTEAT